MILAQNCQKGPERLQKPGKSSADQSPPDNFSNESLVTAKFTNQSITDIESMEIEEYSQETKEDNVGSADGKADKINCHASPNRKNPLIKS